MSNLPAALQPTETDLQMLLAASCHIGSKNCDKHMESYVWKRRVDGVNLIHVGKIWEKIVLAARIIASIENPADVCVISARPYGQRAAHKFAHFTGAKAIAGRFTPGTFTNYITKTFKEPRLIIVTDPRTDHQAIEEASYVNIPTIALCDTDSPLRCVDVAIPTNNKGKHSIGLVYWLLAREVLRLRGTISREQPWETMVDMFFYRDPEDVEKPAEEAAAEGVWGEDNAAAAGEANADWAAGAVTGQDWTAPVAATDEWASEAWEAGK